MGYFSELDLTMKEEYIDRSYHGFEDQLLWRYEDLKDRYLELSDADAPPVGDAYFSKDDYRYTPIECFTTLRDVWRALEVAKEDLELKCGIIVKEDCLCENKDETENDQNQMTVFEIAICPSFFLALQPEKNT